TYGLAVIFYPYQVDYMEGPILDQVVRRSRCENIFTIPTATGPFTVGNYPPVFQLGQVPFAWAAGPALWYGRAVSWAAAAATAFLLAATIYSLTRDSMAAAVSGLVFVSVPYVAMWAPLDRID